MIRNVLAFIGLLAIIAAVSAGVKLQSTMTGFDENAPRVYKDFVGNLIAARDPAAAMIWSVDVAEGISAQQVKDSLISLATEKNMFFAGAAPFYKQVQAVTGNEFRHVEFLSFCDIRAGINMANYNDAYTAMMPCTVSIVKGLDGKLRLFSMDMDFLIYGGKELPPEVKEGALRVRNNLKDMMLKAAEGDF